VREPPRRHCADEARPEREGENNRHCGERHTELSVDRNHDEEEDCEVESIEGPAQPRGPPCVPLLPCRLLPPRDAARVAYGRCHGALPRYIDVASGSRVRGG